MGLAGNGRRCPAVASIGGGWNRRRVFLTLALFLGFLGFLGLFGLFPARWRWCWQRLSLRNNQRWLVFIILRSVCVRRLVTLPPHSFGMISTRVKHLLFWGGGFFEILFKILFKIFSGIFREFFGILLGFLKILYKLRDSWRFFGILRNSFKLLQRFFQKSSRFFGILRDFRRFFWVLSRFFRDSLRFFRIL